MTLRALVPHHKLSYRITVIVDLKKIPNYTQYHGVDEESKTKVKLKANKTNQGKFMPIIGDYINPQCEPCDTRSDRFSYVIAKCI